MENKQPEKKQEEQSQPEKPKMRQIIIETNGNIAAIVKAEVAGSLELKAILQGLIDNLR